MMSATTRNRCPGIDSFIICFYCNETFRSLSSLLKHCCSAEQQISLDLEPFETILDTNSIDLDQEDSIVSSETSSEKPSDTPGQEIAETESNVSNVGETSFSETECEKAFAERKSNATSQEITELASDASEKRLSETNSDVVREVVELATDASEKQVSEPSSNAIEATEIATEEPEIQLPVSDARQKITEGEHNPGKELNTASPDLVTKVLLYYVKETKPGTPDSCSKSPSTEVGFQSCSPLAIVESGSPRHDTEIECSATDNSNEDLSSETKSETYEKNIIQKKSDTLKHNARELECQASNICSRSLPTIESDSSNMFSRSSSVEMDLDSLGCGDDRAESDDSEESNTLLSSEKKSDLLKHDHVPAESHTFQSSVKSDSSNMFSRSSSVEMDLDSLGCGGDPAESDDSEESNTLLSSEKKSDLPKLVHAPAESHAFQRSVNSLLEENLNITKHNSKVVKPCYVKVQDIFKSLVDAKVSPQKIFSWKKKYHICDVCNKFFRLKSDLNIHYLVHTTEKSFVCNICNKSFIKQCDLFAHHRAHNIKRNHVCSVCEKSFPKKSLLLRHELTHTKEKPYGCDKCDKSYSSKSSLKEHYLSHSSERPFICEICSATFANRRYLRKHYYSHKKKDHVCKFCFKAFKRKHHLEEHYNFHINDRPHKCKICNKSFHLLLTLNNHYTVAHRNEYSLIFPETLKTTADCKIGTNPVIQKIEISKVDKSEKTAVVENLSMVQISKDTLSYSTRRKSFIPKKHLQRD